MEAARSKAYSGDCTNLNAAKATFQKTKAHIYFCFEKQNLCFIGTLVLSSAHTPAGLNHKAGIRFNQV
nr:hypothetical protein [Pedobacter kyonggii]